MVRAKLKRIVPAAAWAVNGSHTNRTPMIQSTDPTIGYAFYSQEHRQITTDSHLSKYYKQVGNSKRMTFATFVDNDPLGSSYHYSDKVSLGPVYKNSGITKEAYYAMKYSKANLQSKPDTTGPIESKTRSRISRCSIM
jgi:hypothetical protein